MYQIIQHSILQSLHAYLYMNMMTQKNLNQGIVVTAGIVQAHPIVRYLLPLPSSCKQHQDPQEDN
jgi:hypothetical protein